MSSDRVNDPRMNPGLRTADPELTPAEAAAGLVAYHPRMMMWPDGDLADPVVRPDPDKVYGVGGGIMVERSGGWRSVRLDWVTNHQGKCMACGSDRRLQVHHKRPFHLHPELELDKTNFITLCEGGRAINCHLLIGHGLDWKRYVADPDAVADYVRKAVFLTLQPQTRLALMEAVKTILDGKLLRVVG